MHKRARFLSPPSKTHITSTEDAFFITWGSHNSEMSGDLHGVNQNKGKNWTYSSELQRTYLTIIISHCHFIIIVRFKKQINMQSGTMLTLWLLQKEKPIRWTAYWQPHSVLLNQENTFYHWAASHKSNLIALNSLKWKVQCLHLNIYTAYILTEARLYPAVSGPSCWNLAWGKWL